MPYVWGGAGPTQFDCSGLVQWSMAQAGIVMPRVAADQARTGPLLPLSQLQPGDLLFYHTDPTAPSYISHVAIYIGNGQMLQAPEPGMNVEIVPADFGAGFAGAVRVYPRIAAAGRRQPGRLSHRGSRLAGAQRAAPAGTGSSVPDPLSRSGGDRSLDSSFARAGPSRTPSRSGSQTARRAACRLRQVELRVIMIT